MSGRTILGGPPDVPYDPPDLPYSTAVLSEDGRYRYELWRTVAGEIGSKGTVAFCMLNPSTADAAKDDPTIRRCIGYARSWGYHRLAVVNLFAYRATDPRELQKWFVEHPELDDEWTERNWQSLTRVLAESDLTVAAWGVHALGTPAETWAKRWPDWRVLGLTRDGAPVHPLYQRRSAKPLLWGY